MKRQKIETFINILGEWVASYSSWEYETGSTEKEAIDNLKRARKARELRQKERR